MRTFLISYDLRVPETSEDYKKLIAYIKTFSWAKLLYSVWLIQTEKTVAQIRDELKQETDANDRAIVIDVTGCNWATSNVAKEVTDWMKANM
jgi:23S rRNA pseudoU1915 N3-methylase RlmH